MKAMNAMNAIEREDGMSQSCTEREAKEGIFIDIYFWARHKQQHRRVRASLLL